MKATHAVDYVGRCWGGGVLVAPCWGGWVCGQELEWVGVECWRVERTCSGWCHVDEAGEAVELAVEEVEAEGMEAVQVLEAVVMASFE